LIASDRNIRSFLQRRKLRFALTALLPNQDVSCDDQTVARKQIYSRMDFIPLVVYVIHDQGIHNKAQNFCLGIIIHLFSLKDHGLGPRADKEKIKQTDWGK
jgi:hypothetical protein